MRLHLPSLVFAASAGEDLVILDAARGRYFCVPGGSIGAVRCGDWRFEAAGPDVQEALLDQRLARLSPDEFKDARSMPPKAQADLGTLPQALGALRTSRLLLTLMSLAARTYWGRSFDEMMRRLSRQSERRLRTDLEAAKALAQAFSAALPWMPFQGACLFRSVLLRQLLVDRGLASTFVIGVQTWPFEAHAWLQVGETVLDDSVDHVRTFAPLVAL